MRHRRRPRAGDSDDDPGRGISPDCVGELDGNDAVDAGLRSGFVAPAISRQAWIPISTSAPPRNHLRWPSWRDERTRPTGRSGRSAHPGSGTGDAFRSRGGAGPEVPCASQRRAPGARDRHVHRILGAGDGRGAARTTAWWSPANSMPPSHGSRAATSTHHRPVGGSTSRWALRRRRCTGSPPISHRRSTSFSSTPTRPGYLGYLELLLDSPLLAHGRGDRGRQHPSAGAAVWRRRGHDGQRRRDCVVQRSARLRIRGWSRYCCRCVTVSP